MSDRERGECRKPDYEKDGYSARSLEMLDSEEGQLNAVFACFGSAARHGQLFEDSLSKLATLLNGLRGDSNPAAGLDKKMIGQLLRQLEKDFVEEIDQWVPEFLDQARTRRNFLIHEYFLKRSEEMGSAGGRLAILRELVGIEEQLRRGAALVNGLRVAIEETKKEEGTEPCEEERIFSVKLRMEGKAR